MGERLPPVPWVKDLDRHIFRCAGYCRKLRPDRAYNWAAAQAMNSVRALQAEGWSAMEAAMWSEAYLRWIMADAGHGEFMLQLFDELPDA